MTIRHPERFRAARLRRPKHTVRFDPNRYIWPAEHRTRGRYIPAGPNRNCGDRGISPKRVRG